MPAFCALVFVTLLLPSLPHVGDAFRVQLNQAQAIVEAKGMVGETGNRTCRISTPSILAGNLSQEYRSSVADAVFKMIIERFQRFASVPDNGFSLSFRDTKSTIELLDRGPSKAATLGFAAEWMLFEGGYTIKKNWLFTHRGNAFTGFKNSRAIQHIPTTAHRVIAYTVVYAVDNPKKVIVFCHMNADNIEGSDTYLRKMGEHLQAAIVGFEYPGYGDPVRDMDKTTVGYSTLESVKFVTLAGVNWVRQVWGVDEKDIIMAGQSIGTGAATEVAWHYEKAGKPLGGLILISPYSSIGDLTKSFIQRVVAFGAPALTALAVRDDIFQTAAHLKEMSETPLFALHAEDDRIIPFSQFQQLQSILNEGYRTSGKVTFVPIEKGKASLGHNFNTAQINSIFDKDEFLDWIRKNEDCLQTPHKEGLRDIDLRTARREGYKESLLRLVIPRRLAPTASFFGACGGK